MSSLCFRIGRHPDRAVATASRAPLELPLPSALQAPPQEESLRRPRRRRGRRGNQLNDDDDDGLGDQPEDGGRGEHGRGVESSDVDVVTG